MSEGDASAPPHDEMTCRDNEIACRDDAPRLVALCVHEAAIPLRVSIRHASHERTANAALLVRAELSDGSVGWGEGLPREYVTGETIDTAWQQAAEFAGLVGEPVPSMEAAAALAASVVLPANERGCRGPSTRCAVELALLDAAGRASDRSLTDYVASLLPQASEPQPVRYSAVLPASSTVRRAAYRALRMRVFGLGDVKVKLGVDEDDGRTLRLARLFLGRRVRRVDANEAWTPHELTDKLALLEAHRVAICEQPLPHGERATLDGRDAISPCGERSSPVRLMLDESFCTAADFEETLEHGRASVFNVRLSKCGGITASCRLLARIAATPGCDAQLGCQVGETAILSAAGRAVASVLGQGERRLVAVEGSYDRFLVGEPLSREDLTFGRGGWAPPLAGPGLGITIDGAAVARTSVRSRRWTTEPSATPRGSA